MKILFINTSDTHGGAAIAAHRLLTGLKKHHDVDVQYLVGKKLSDKSYVKQTRTELQKVIELGINRITNVFGYQYYWFPFSQNTILKTIDNYQPDIISLHNTHGGYFPTNLIQKISKKIPIVWTLHDMWSFTGHSAYTLNSNWVKARGENDIKAHPAIGLNRSEILLNTKLQIYKHANLLIVTPSVWLYDLVKKSPVFQSKKITHVFNGIDTTRYKPLKRLKNKDLKIVFGTSSTKNKIKGYEDLKCLVNYLKESKKNITIYVFGKGSLDKKISSIENKILKIKQLGYINSNQIIDLFQKSDILLYPSKIDNLPNTLIEAQACGLPAITYNSGGCVEIIKDKKTGFVVNSLEEMKNTLNIILNNPQSLTKLSKNARKNAIQNFSIKTMTKKYISLFRKILNEN